MLRLRRRCAQTARISLHVPSCQRAQPSDKKRAMRQIPGVSPRALPSDFPNLSSNLAAASVRHRRVSASVRRYLRTNAKTRKRKKCGPSHFFRISLFLHKIWGLRARSLLLTPQLRNILAAAQRDSGPQRGRTAPRNQPQRQQSQNQPQIDQ